MALMPAGLLLLAAGAPLVSMLVPRFLGTLPLACAGLCLIGSGFGARLRPLPDRRLILAVAGFLALCAASAIWAVDPGFVLERVAKMTYTAVAGLVLWMAAIRIDPVWLRRIGVVFCVSVALAGVLLLEEMTGHLVYRAVRGLSETAPVSPHALNREAVVLATLIWPTLPLIAAGPLLMRWPRPLRQGLAILAPLVLALALFRTESQSAMAGILVGAAVYALAVAMPPAWVRRVLLAGIIAGLVSAPLWGQGLQAMQPRLITSVRGAAVGARMEIWDAVARRALERPVLGWGLEVVRTFSHAALFDRPVRHMRNRPLTLHPHNGALQIWIELGGIGVLAASGLLLLLGRRIAGFARAMQPAALAGLAALSLMAVVSHGLWQSWWLGLISTAITGFALAGRAIALWDGRQKPEEVPLSDPERHGPSVSAQKDASP